MSENYNNQDEVLHFDLETFQNTNITNGFKIHTPYITGEMNLNILLVMIISLIL
jgi:hypothetical protein